jgi:hypothetical protein
MTARSERDVILEHALRDEENLTVALKVGAAYEELCGMILAKLLDAIEKELTPQLGVQWQVTVCRDPEQLAKETELLVATFRGPPEGFRIALGVQGNRYPKRPWLAVRTQVDLPALENALKQAIDKAYGAGKTSDQDLWYQMINDKPYSGWGSEDFLVGLRRSRDNFGDAVKYFSSRLEQLARVVAKTLGENPAA